MGEVEVEFVPKLFATPEATKVPLTAVVPLEFSPGEPRRLVKFGGDILAAEEFAVVDPPDEEERDDSPFDRFPFAFPFPFALRVLGEERLVVPLALPLLPTTPPLDVTELLWCCDFCEEEFDDDDEFLDPEEDEDE